MIKIRKAKLKDLRQITEIYNQAIVKTVATFDTEIKTLKEQKKWFKNHGSKNPIIVAEEKGSIVGFACLSKWSDKCAYSLTAEISIYVKNDYQGKGIGKKLMEEIIKEGEKAGLHAVIARITAGNKSSINLHEKFGFEHIGVMKEVGKKFGKFLDVYLMEKLYNK